ncbi:MAG: DMT family transporter [Candidatus Kariarchaeaceae archaeon]|jgi:drug/metabolite transporter (DMT)-like permease
MADTPKQDAVTGPVLILGANSLRAFDSPVRNPVISEWDPSTASVEIDVPRSTYVVTCEHIIGTIIMSIAMFFSWKEGKRRWKRLTERLQFLSRREWFAVLFIGAGSSALGLWFFTLALVQNVNSAIVTQKIQPLISIFMAILILKEKPSQRFFVGSGVAFAGLILVAVGDWNNIFGTGAFLAVILSLTAAFFWGSGTVFGRMLTPKLDNWEITTIRYIVGTLFLILMLLIITMVEDPTYAVLNEEFTVWGIYELTWLGWICILYMTIVPGLIPLVIYYAGLKRTQASIAGIMELSFPILGVFVGVYILEYEFHWWQYLGAVILISAVTIIAYWYTKEMEALVQEEKQVSV